MPVLEPNEGREMSDVVARLLFCCSCCCFGGEAKLFPASNFGLITREKLVPAVVRSVMLHSHGEDTEVAHEAVNCSQESLPALSREEGMREKRMGVDKHTHAERHTDADCYSFIITFSL
jgi:hypothetical protein